MQEYWVIPYLNTFRVLVIKIYAFFELMVVVVIVFSGKEFTLEFYVVVFFAAGDV
jgi:hypothetical protein